MTARDKKLTKLSFILQDSSRTRMSFIRKLSSDLYFIKGNTRRKNIFSSITTLKFNPKDIT